MNKKVLTLCAAMILGGSSLVSVNASDFKASSLSVGLKTELAAFVEANSNAVTSGEKTLTLKDNVKVGDEKNFLLIDQDDFVLDGKGFTWKGRIVVTGENVTIKNLNIDYTNVLTPGAAGEDGTRIENKSAITVFAKNITIDKCTIACSTENSGFMANGISIYPLSTDSKSYKITNTTIKNASNIVVSNGWPDAPSFGIEVISDLTDSENETAGFTYFESESVHTSVALNDLSVLDLTGTKFEYCATDVANIKVDTTVEKDFETYVNAVVTPNYDAAGKLVNGLAIQKAVEKAKSGAVLEFKGTAEEFMAAWDSNTTTADVAVACTDMNVLFNDATAPENGKPSNVVSGGIASAPATMGGYKLVADADKLKGYYLLGMTGTDRNSYVATSENKLVKLSDVTLNESYLWKMTESIKDGKYIYTFTNYATGKLLVASSAAGTGEDTTFEPVDNQPYNGGLLLAVNGTSMGDPTPAYYGLYKYSDEAATLVEWKELVNKADYFNIVSKDDATEGKVLSVVEAINGSNTVGLVDAETVLLSSPEAQWYISKVEGGKVTFTNRENTSVSTTASYVYNTAEGVYKINGKKVALNAVENVTEFDGFKNYSDAEMANATYTIASYSAVRGDAYFAENHKDSHKIGLTSDVDAATTWSLDKFNASTDTIKIENKIVKWNADAYTFDEVKDTLKVLSYAIQNEANGEYIIYNDEADNKFYTCAETANDRTNAIRFALKAQPNGTYNLVEVNGNALRDVKMYAGDSEKNGMLNRISTIYDQTENDLFTIASSVKRDYRRVANLDTIAIYREANPSELLFEQGENGINFLGYKNDNQFKFAPNMVAIETYSDAENDYYKPEYMLVVDPTIVPADTAWCDATTHKHETLADSLACAHTVITPAYITGRFLVNYADSAAAWTTENIHPTNNPYLNNGESVRLGFVEGTYTYDKDAKKPFLAIKKAGATKSDTLMVSNAGLTAAEFAFKYVDADTESFNIETEVDESNNAQFIKLINGVAVLNNEESTVNPEVFNISEDYAGDPTANEEISAEAASVVVAGTNGAVVVKGAEGKSVIVSTILGKVVANEVLTSDNAQIAAPAGVVVVSVDGESFKVVVK